MHTKGFFLEAEWRLAATLDVNSVIGKHPIRQHGKVDQLYLNSKQLSILLSSTLKF